MNKYAFSGLALAAVLAGCGGALTTTQAVELERSLMHGPSISDKVERIKRTPENVLVARDHKEKAEQVVKTQPNAAPLPMSDDALELDSVAENLFKHIKAAGAFADGDLAHEDMVKLEPSASGILIHSRELLTVFDRRATEARITSEIMTRKKDDEEGATGGQGAEVAALQEWVTVAERVERSAIWFNRGVQTKAPDLIRKGWAALLEAGRQLPQIRAGIDMMALKRKN